MMNSLYLIRNRTFVWLNKEFTYILVKNKINLCVISSTIFAEFLDKYNIGNYNNFHKSKYDNLRYLIQFLKDKNIYKDI